MFGDSPWVRFAILHKPTGKYLPERWRRGRGYSYDEPSHDFPRLFPSERSAKAALRNWLMGRWKRDIRFRYSWDGPDEIETLKTEKVKGRNADEMEIVRFKIEGIW